MNRKTCKCISLILVIIFSISWCSLSFSDESDFNKKVLAPSFILFEADDPETYIYAKKPDMKIMPASTTKIMTCILALENCPDLNEIVSVPDNATTLKSTNTLMGLKRGEQLPLIDLLYGMMLPSGNDAAITVATHVSGSVEAFAELMNTKAQELGMTNTHFTNASGVYNGQHYSTCRDMGRLAAYAMKNEMFRKIVSTAEYDVPANEARKSALHLVNTNRLVSDPETSDFFYEFAIGCKTGSTEKGGKCLVAAAQKNGVTLIALLLGVKEGGDKSTRIRRCFTDAKMLFEAAYNNLYAFIPASEFGLFEYTIESNVTNATKRNNETGVLSCTADFSYDSAFIRSDISSALRDDPSLFQVDTVWDDANLTAPIKAGEKLGVVTASYRGRTLYTADLKASREVKAYDPAEDITPSPAPTSTPAPTPSPTTIPKSPETETNVSSKAAIFIYISFILLCTAILSLFSISKTTNKHSKIKRNGK